MAFVAVLVGMVFVVVMVVVVVWSGQEGGVRNLATEYSAGHRVG